MGILTDLLLLFRARCILDFHITFVRLRVCVLWFQQLVGCLPRSRDVRGAGQGLVFFWVQTAEGGGCVRCARGILCIGVRFVRM